LAGATPPETVRAVAEAAEQAGFRSLWLNEAPGIDALAALLPAASATSRLRLGVGVLPFDRSPAEAIAERVERLGLPLDRLVLGVGSGAAPHAAAVVESGVRALRGLVTVPILVGGLGPRVRRLGAELADGALLSWLSPATAAEARDEAVAQAAEAGRPRPRIALYARTAVDAAAHAALVDEAERYAAYPSYAANFARIGLGPLDGSILATDSPTLKARIAEYDGTVDELVLRAITLDNSADEVRRIIEAAAA
jgi:alkanesulfonate monooxygenase SsuD/methylene tetrahydromethanopterin reductase-like flavin-dependent oxidoreductase (luciferase family)